jgi:hypothetical protein
MAQDTLVLLVLRSIIFQKGYRYLVLGILLARETKKIPYFYSPRPKKI